MEVALNLVGLFVATVLVAGCIAAKSSRSLRVPFAAALGCTVLLAVILFPAISMTDDLQRMDLQAEVGLGSDLALLHTPLAGPLELVLAVLLFALVALGVRMLAQRAIVAAQQDQLLPQLLAYRPLAVRPPTV